MRDEQNQDLSFIQNLVFVQLLGGNVFVLVDLLVQGYRPALSLLPHPKLRMGLISVGLGVC